MRVEVFQHNVKGTPTIADPAGVMLRHQWRGKVVFDDGLECEFQAVTFRRWVWVNNQYRLPQDALQVRSKNNYLSSLKTYPPIRNLVCQAIATSLRES
jgi:hypothetical protein